MTRAQRRRARRRAVRLRYVAVSAAGVALVGVVSLLVWVLVPASTPARARSTTNGVATAAAPTVRRIPGRRPSGPASVLTPDGASVLTPDGMVGSAIVTENQKAGTTAWRITNPPKAGMVEGFANRDSVTQGGSFGLYVSTTAPSFGVVAYRMGYYQGTGGREVWASSQVPGHQQPACPVDKTTNMVSCDDWSRSMTVQVTADWPAGDYVLKLTGSGNEQAYVLITVWDPASHATYMVVNRTLTEQGWNTFGGYDFYQGEGSCILDNNTYPACNRARVVSLDRPYADSQGATDFFPNEYPLIFWMEEHGLDVTYATDITLTEHPAFALQHRAWLSLDHDETWTYRELEGAKVAVAAGVNLLFFSGAAIVRHSRLQASPLGADREEVDYRNSSEDPGARDGDPHQVTSNTWPAVDSSLTGQEYAGYLRPGAPQVPMVVYDASSWLFNGTGLHDGSQIPDVIGSDIDHLDPASGLVPKDLQVLAHSPVPLSEAYTSQSEWWGSTYSDFTYYTDPSSGAGVIDTGNTTFLVDLSFCTAVAGDCQPTLERIVANMLYVFGEGPAGRVDPPHPNWQSVTPSGS